ncbi:MAG: 3-dehydroquinate synthase [Firmicutes bacterium]|nr:3-dehydroquinate synthase [Bacillota bacterium]
MSFLENNLTGEIKEIVSFENSYLIIDSVVAKLYPELTKAKNKYILKAKEENKNLETVALISKEMLNCSSNRHTRIVAVGGGLTNDVAGFVASIYMRGIDWISIPTTLLSMVDASIGGKTGVNFEGNKNIIGSFYSPKCIYSSLHFLKTLDAREKMSGIGEVVKSMFLTDELFKFLEINLKGLMEFDEETLSEFIKKCIKLKEQIVKVDPLEKGGIRKILNIGHTVGHALETANNFKISHGECVLFGMLFESAILKKYVPLEKYLPKMNLLKKILKGRKIKFDSSEIVKACKCDKKNENGKISIMSGIDGENHKEYFFSNEELIKCLEDVKAEFKEFL